MAIKGTAPKQKQQKRVQDELDEEEKMPCEIDEIKPKTPQQRQQQQLKKSQLEEPEKRHWDIEESKKSSQKEPATTLAIDLGVVEEMASKARGVKKRKEEDGDPRKKVVAIGDYDATDIVELTIKEGDIIYL